MHAVCNSKWKLLLSCHLPVASAASPALSLGLLVLFYSMFAMSGSRAAATMHGIQIAPEPGTSSVLHLLLLPWNFQLRFVRMSVLLLSTAATVTAETHVMSFFDTCWLLLYGMARS